MIQLELYIREIVRFLRTMTIKNEYFKEQMEESYASDAFKGKYPDELHPYYRHLLGKSSYESFNEFRSVAGIPDTVSDAQIAVDYGFDYVKVLEDGSAPITYCTINGIRVLLRSDIVSIDGVNYRVYPNCVYYYGQICPVKILYKEYDELMVISSIDTHEIVPFNSYTLKTKRHQKTASLYRMPSRYYTKLCSKYPLSMDMIKAIVYPVPSLDACVNAPNYGLISCDLTQLKENERTSLYTRVLDILAMIQRRWDVPDFTYEELYALSIQAKIWNVLLLALMEQRVANIRTSAAHEYHIWEYLKSHGLDDYSDVLNEKQTLFLYRNFPYILRNRGSDFNLVLLAHKLLSDWNIVITGKNVLQTSNDFQETCKASPTIDSIVVGKTVLDELREIDNNDINYLNKTIKFSDELNAFDYRQSDLQQMQAGTIETLQSTYEKEQEAGLEYQLDPLFQRSTTQQTRQFSYTPHTSFVTKLLEISKETTSTLFQQIYARFITESLLYRTAIGQADYMVSIIPEGMSYSINLEVKDAIGLVWFCALRELGWFDNDAAKPYPYMYLTVPYKEKFDPIPETFFWNNQEHQTLEILRCLPTKFTLISDELPVELTGEFEIVDTSAAWEEWTWKNQSEITIRFKTDGYNRYWVLKTPTVELRADFRYPYHGWKYQEFVWKYGTSTYSSIVKLDSYEYLLDAIMPNYETYTYEELIELIHNQTLGYIQIYRELHGSDWSRQHTGVTDIIKQRTVNEVVKLELFNGLSFKEFIDLNADLKEVINRIEGNAEDVARTEYAKLGNSIIKVLFPIETEYIEDNAGVSLNRFNRLKELFINLCSYNITFLEGSVGASDSTLTLTSYITQDYDYGEYGFNSKYFIDTGSLSVAYEHVFYEYFCGFGIGSTILMEPPKTPYWIGDTIDHNAISYDNTTITDPETSEDKVIGHSIVRNTDGDDNVINQTDPNIVVCVVPSCYHNIVSISVSNIETLPITTTKKTSKSRRKSTK